MPILKIYLSTSKEENISYIDEVHFMLVLNDHAILKSVRLLLIFTVHFLLKKLKQRHYLMITHMEEDAQMHGISSTHV